jgi:predicted nucleic acid-binding OB-fold protein
MSAFNDDPRANKPDDDPLADEVSCRILHHEVGGLILAITENSLKMIRIRPNSSAQIQSAGTILVFDDSPIINNVLGTILYRNLSSRAQDSLAEVINSIIIDNPEPYLSFYNRAGNLSLKMHAFALLPGIGNKKALEMVDLRGRDGWEEFDKLNADCGIDGAKILADRLAKEIADHHLEPRLVELLLRQEE